MGLLGKIREKKEQEKELQRTTAKEELMKLSEKELLVEILLELKELNLQSEQIQLNQVIWSN